MKAKPKTIKKVKRVSLFVDISPTSKQWLNRLCLSHPGKMSKATAIETILCGLRAHPNMLKALGL